SSASTPSLPQRPADAFPAKSTPKRPAPLKGAVSARPAARRPAADEDAQSKVAVPTRPQREPVAPSQAVAADTAEMEEEEDERGALSAWIRNSPAWLISMLFHMALILILALLSLSVPEVRKELSMLANSADEHVPLEEMETEIDIPVEVEVEDFTETLQTSDLEAFAPDVNAISETVGIDDSPPAEVSMNDAIVVGPGLESLMADIPGGGSELAKMGQMTKFFGTESSGRRIAFVVDNSNSMTQGRFETALIELYKSVEQLSEKQYFYIVFYSDTAYPLFYPSTEAKMVRATKENKQRVHNWLGTIQMCYYTNGMEAFELAFRQRPDVVYVLGDGAFGDRTDTKFTANPMRHVTLHTLGMQVKPDLAKRFEALAKAHRGTYRDVGITDEGKAMLKREGSRPKNTKRGPIWGVKLPVGGIKK
ncbi:MAG: vWA domain-containing protein, partial [Pirellulales bacterium]